MSTAAPSHDRPDTAGLGPQHRRDATALGRAARFRRRAASALAAITVALLPAASATAGTPTDVAAGVPRDAAEDTITWSVAPADADGLDGRRWVEQTADPGETIDEHLAVTNFADVPATFSLTAADGYLTDKGRFNMLPADRESVDAGTWISVQDDVEVGPGETVVVPYTVSVPDNATPGDHPAGIAASVSSTGSDEGGNSVGVTSRVGFRVMTRVTGEVDPVLAVQDLRASYSPSWNPFAAGDLRVTYDVVNEGNIRLGAESKVETTGPFGIASQGLAGSAVAEVLPGGELPDTVGVDGVWPLFRYTTTVTITPTPVDEDQIDAPLEPVEVTVTTWAIPWPQLLLIAIVVVLVLGIRDDRRRRRKRLDAMLAKARDEGRQAASSGEPPVA
ncbi:hypothetical protein [Cellulosimicrobium arenosum]|uniref:DUF916 domain-containing protein n=1 Tax=Cellulosimicrobium arenosum TaxID=2708133 RepID=A0A927G720_9MICO|nr:hypothetical protein [Cellulosimicrobium arenosum]MBD8078043.1 hypothetical protein [Cellulosimicrobium arenosum]